MSSTLETAIWRKASHSNADNACVGIARPDGAVVGIRNTKAPDAGRLVVTSAAFEDLLARLKA